jgi:uncharacterized phage-like protein YoqJ
MNVTGIGPRFYTLPGAPVRKIEKGEEVRLLLDICKSALTRLGATHLHSTAMVGFDMLVVVGAQELGLPYTIYQPHEGWGRRWNANDRRCFESIMDGASHTVTLAKGRASAVKLKNADRHVVDRAETVLALSNDERQSRTFEAMFYAYSTRTNVENLWREFVRRSDVSSL